MVSESALDGAITSLHLVQNGRTKERLIVGGADDGSVAFWTLECVLSQYQSNIQPITSCSQRSSLQLCARWIIGTTPLINAVQFHDNRASPLHGCVLCVFLDGTIAVIVVDGFHL